MEGKIQAPRRSLPRWARPSLPSSSATLREADLDAIRDHLETCPDCEARAEALDDRTDMVLDDLRRTALGSSPPQAAPVPAPGPPLLPDYEVDDAPLGLGSMGVVYLARHLKLGRVVALKMLTGPSKQAAALFQIEAKAVARLQHPNIVQIFEIGNHEGRPFLALEFVGGGSLDRRIEAGTLHPREAAELIRALALAIDYAHRHGIVHCDLKPSNILLTPDGSPKIADFGVAKWLESGEFWRGEGDVIGTPRYMAPEQAVGQVASVGPAADLYSLGVILWEMLTGRTPHGPAEATDLASDRVPAHPGHRRPRLQRDLETIARKCLRAAPADRYADANRLADDLCRALSGEPLLARPVGPVARVVVAARRHPALVGILVVTALSLASFGVQHRRYREMPDHHEAAPKAGPMSPRVLVPGNHPGTIVQTDGSIRLGAADATVSGRSLVFEPPFGNLGYWHSPEDRAVWNFQIDLPATYTLDLEYSNFNGKAGNSYEVLVDNLSLTGRAIGTESWIDYRPIRAGEVVLTAGVHRLEVRSSGPLRGALFDLRAVVLSPRMAKAGVTGPDQRPSRTEDPPNIGRPPRLP